MTDKPNRKVTKLSGNAFNEFTDYFKLVARLLGDQRVNPFLKLLPIGTILYFIIPDLIIGPIDDALVVWLGTYFFIELCPQDVVQEHKDALSNKRKETKIKVEKPESETPNIQTPENQIEDAEFWDKE